MGQLPMFSCKRRYAATASVAGTFQLLSGHNQFLVCSASGPATFVSWVDMWRIKKIEIWSPLTTVGGSGGCSITAVGASADNMFNDRALILADNTTSLDRAAHIVWKPPKTQPSGSLHFTTTVSSAIVLFNLSCTTDSIVDITYGFVPLTSGALNGYTVTATAGTPAGTLAAKAPMANLVPVGVNVVT